MIHWKHLAPGVLWLVAMPLFAQTLSSPAKPSSDNTKQGSKSTNDVHTRDGQRIFEQNCSRCHDAPESFPPSISGTIVRHMRVRASLSKEDEKALLRFLNP